MIAHDPWTAVLAPCVALAVDRAFGEPPARWHPVVWMGRFLGWAGRRIAPPDGTAPARDVRSFACGALAWAAGACAVVAVALAAQALLAGLPPWCAAVLAGVLLKPMLAWQMLHDEVLAVEHALAGSLDAGRSRLGALVSRDVARLDEGQVRESAIESLAENLNDSLLAPLFWYALAGLPGAALYRFANTADAMWGYRGARAGRVWEWAGKFAARADDVLSWLPARITAVLLALAGRRWPHGLRAQARLAPSPNGGWPMAAMALLLDVRLAKPGAYAFNRAGRPPVPQDTARALRLAGRVVALAALVAAALALAVAAAAGDTT